MSGTEVFLGDPTQLLGDRASGPVDVVRRSPQNATISVFDLGLVRGDGIFEATTVFEGTPLAWELHLHRLALSAAMMELPAPATAALREFTLACIAQAAPPRFAQLKLMITRGEDGSLSAGRPGTPNVILILDPVSPARAKKPEIDIVTLEREVVHGSAQRAPWLLLGAKTLSYAMNMATRREFTRRGADDGVFVTRDGYVMEGPQSSIVIREGDHVVTPDPSIGVLHGTSQRELFAWAELNGLETAYELLPMERLFAADQVWMMGASVIQSVRTVDGTPVRNDRAATQRINEFVRTERGRIDDWVRANILV